MNQNASSAFRIVVGVDFTDVGDHALDEAIRYITRLDNNELHPVFVITEAAKRDLGKVNRFLVEARDQLRTRVIERCAAVGREWKQQVILHVRLGEPAAAIHQVAVDVDADLIVVGTHARNGLSKMLLGSVAEELVRTAHVPVMVARPKELDHLEKSPQLDPARPGEDLHQPRVMSSELLTLGKRSSHIAGLV